MKPAVPTDKPAIAPAAQAPGQSQVPGQAQAQSQAPERVEPKGTPITAPADKA
jgi:hypothetical protein